MNLLAIDTSTEQASISLSFRGNIQSKSRYGYRNHAQSLLPLIEELLSEAGCNLNQLDAIVYGRGPGSFTGLRIGCSIAKGLAYAHNLQLIPVSTLQAIAHEVWHRKQIENNTDKTRLADTKAPVSIISLLDARMNQVYWACFSYDPQSPPIDTDTLEFVTDAAAVDVDLETPVIIAGINFENYLGFLPPKLQDQIIEQQIIYPEASAMIRIASTGKIKPISAAEASLVYIRNQIIQKVSHG